MATTQPATSWWKHYLGEYPIRIRLHLTGGKDILAGFLELAHARPCRGCGFVFALAFSNFVGLHREGTGLGLSMSYDIDTQQHGGSISVDSKVGEYSEFRVRLPRRP
jgi:hypothetical protein